MSYMSIEVVKQADEHAPLKIRVTDAESGAEIFHAEVWNFSEFPIKGKGSGSGDIDIFATPETRMTILEWVNGSPTLRHVSPVNHIAIDFLKPGGEK